MGNEMASESDGTKEDWGALILFCRQTHASRHDGGESGDLREPRPLAGFHWCPHARETAEMGGPQRYKGFGFKALKGDFGYFDREKKP